MTNIDDMNRKLQGWHERMKSHDARIPADEKPPQVEQVSFSVGVENDQVVLRFGKPIAWITFPPDQALVVANDLLQKVKQIKGVEE